MMRSHLLYLSTSLFIFSSLAADKGAETLSSSIESLEIPTEFFFQKLPLLLQQEKWSDVVILGEEALKQSLSPEQRFSVLDQLVSSYFRLGSFDKAEEKAQRLIELGSYLNKPDAIVDSLYKLSAALRGKADLESDSEKKDFLYAQAKHYVKEALVISEERCPDDLSLRAKVLFNAGAAVCDDPKGDVNSGIAMYKEALSIFSTLKEEDYQQRTAIRLAKAYLLIEDFISCRTIIEELHHKKLERRTGMHLCYLEAQLYLAEGNETKALSLALHGLEEAKNLNAQQDIKRFEILISRIEQQ